MAIQIVSLVFSDRANFRRGIGRAGRRHDVHNAGAVEFGRGIAITGITNE